jgi:hypothetical protein
MLDLTLREVLGQGSKASMAKDTLHSELRVLMRECLLKERDLAEAEGADLELVIAAWAQRFFDTTQPNMLA